MKTTLIASTEFFPGDGVTIPFRVVLRKREDPGGMPFVTWCEDKAGNRWWGHYFETEEEAQPDFADRAERYGLEVEV